MKSWYYDSGIREDPAMRAQTARVFLEKRAARSRRSLWGVGHVVEFLRRGEHQCGVLLSERRRHVRVLDQEGKEVSVDRERIVDISHQMLYPWQPHDQTIQALREIDQRREDIKRLVELRTLWEIVGESESREWTLNELADLYFGGDAGSDRRSALSRTLDDGHLFVRRGRKFTALDPQAVKQHDRSAREVKRSEEWFRNAGAWLRSVADGKPGVPPERSERAIKLLEGEVLLGSDHPEAQEASKLMQAAHLHGPHAAFGVLVKLGHWDPDENLDLLRHNVPISFSSEAVAEAEKCDWTQEALRCPALRRGRIYGLIDREGNCHQAVSIRRRLLGYTVGIHFASPALLIPQGERVQGEAADRGGAIHLPDRVVPMLPPEITPHLRLTTEEWKPTLTVELRLSWRLDVRRSSIRLKRVRVTHAQTLEHMDQSIPHDRHLGKLYRLARGRYGKRREAGAVVTPEPELEIMASDQTVDVRLDKPDRPSRVIARELTLLAGSLVGDFCVKKQIPAIYRVRESPPELVITRDEYDPVTSREQKRRMTREHLQVSPDRHGVLGLEQLAVVEDSVGRYPDLLVHQQLIHFLQYRETIYSTEELKHALLYTRWARDTVHQIERSSRRYWLLRYMEQFIGREVEAVVLERARSGYLVELCETLLWVFMRTRPDVHLSIGTRIWVSLMHVSARRDEFRVANPRPVES